METPLMKSLREEPEKTLSVIRLDKINDLYETISSFSSDFVYPISDDLIEQIIVIGMKKMKGWFNVQEVQDHLICIFMTMRIEIDRDRLKIYVLENTGKV